MFSSMRVHRWTAAALVVLGLALLPALAIAQTAGYSATLLGSNHTPPVTTSATGTFTASLTGDVLSYTLTVPSITAATAAHIHVGAAGENGGVTVPLFAADGSVASINVSETFDLADLAGPYEGDPDGFRAAFSGGTLYVNVHTEGNPGGELRGQIESAMAMTPAATGNAGLRAEQGAASPSTIALLLGAAAVVVLGGRVLTARERRGR